MVYSNCSVDIVIPIYKTSFDEMEYFSINHSLGVLSNYPAVFVHPEGLDLAYYREYFPDGTYLSLPSVYFESHRNYNQLCYQVEFYNLFSHVSHILILQPDALVARPDLDRWCASRYDFLGGPECNVYSYDIRGISPFSKLDYLEPIRLSGCNGGLSLRRINAIVAVLEEYKELTLFFRNYGVGIGEDIFFSLMGRVSDSFQVANEFAASKFAITEKFPQWIEFNNGNIPFGFHGWYKSESDKTYILKLLSEIKSASS
jgi:hypothetical protein